MTNQVIADVVEELGAAVDAGLLDREEAIQRLVEFSAGGLTPLGAGHALDEWQTIRARYGDIFMKTEMILAAVEAALRAKADEQD